MTPGCGDDELHVWRTALAVGGDAYNGLASVLSRDERERADRYHADTDRRRFVVARASLRNILSWYTGVAPGALVFHHGEYGKPSLAAGSGDGCIRFNLSHSSDVALCAVTRCQDVGVDIEQVVEDLPAERIAAQFFSPPEQCLVGESENPAEAFARIWVRKEAYLKATGRGIGSDLSGFSVTLDRSEMFALKDERGRSWTIQDLPAPSGYAAAVATPAPLRVSMREYSELGDATRSRTPE